MTDLSWILMCVVVFYVLLYWARYLLNIYVQKKIEKIENEVLEQLIVPTKLEKHQGCYYLFRIDNDAFLCQGHNAKELSSNLKLRFRSGFFTIHEGMDQEFREQLIQIDDEIPNASSGIEPS